VAVPSVCELAKTQGEDKVLVVFGTNGGNEGKTTFDTIRWPMLREQVQLLQLLHVEADTLDGGFLAPRRSKAAATRSVALVAALFTITAAPGAEARDAAFDEAQLYALAPQILQLAAMDPLLAASLVPDAWIDRALLGALEIEAEVPAHPPAADPPQRWPIGPWASPAALARTLRAIDPDSVVALYRALEPRRAARCRHHAKSLAACERALRAAASRLVSRSVLNRAAHGPAEEITATQRELARLGVPVVMALRDKVSGVGTRLWGAPRRRS
jgi:hypothetical protein